MSTSGPSRALELLDHWRQGVRTVQKLHYDRAKTFARRNLALGVPAAVLSGVAGTSVLVSIVEPLGMYGKIGLGLVSLLAATLSILQTTLKYDERAEKHRHAGSGYGALNRALEHALTVPPASDEAADVLIARFEVQFDQIAQYVPALPRKQLNNIPAGYVPEPGKVDLAGRTNTELRLLELDAHYAHETMLAPAAGDHGR